MPLDELGVKAIEDYTLEIKLLDACSYYDAMLTYTAFFPLREDVVLEDGTGHWAWEVERAITNGRMIMTACDEEQELVLEKNPNYYGKDSVALDKLVVKLVDDTNTTLQLFETGAGCTLGDVVKTTVFLTDMGAFAAVNAVYAKYFEGDCPARSAVQDVIKPEEPKAS